MISKKQKEVLKVVVAVVIVFLFFDWGVKTFLRETPSGSPEHKRDVSRMSDVSSVRHFMEIYYDKNNSKYFQSSTIPDFIGNSEVPKDPSGKSYGWIDNTSDDQKYCVWAELEKKKEYFIISRCGSFNSVNPPKILDDCCELTQKK